MWASVLAVEIPIGFIAGGEKEIETERSQRREALVLLPGRRAALESGVADWREVRASDVAGCSPAVTRHSCAATANPIPNFHPLALGNQNPFGNYSGADDGNADVARGGTLQRRIHNFP